MDGWMAVQSEICVGGGNLNFFKARIMWTPMEQPCISNEWN